MDFMTIFGAIFVFFCHTGSTSKLFSGQRICRRGTERPCYRLAHIPDPRQRVSYEEAREACRGDSGELLSVETEDEQRLVERFVHELSGDFWIGLRRSLRHREPGTSCSALYYWLDRSQATYRNWQWDEPSCGREMCVVLHQRPSQVGGVNYKWNDVSCNLRHNFICKYTDEKKYDVIVTPAPPRVNPEAPVISVTPNQGTVTGDDRDVRAGVSESSVSSTDATLNILLITIPLLLLLLLLGSGLFCYRLMANRRKEPSEPIYAKPGQWVSKGSSASASILFSQQGEPLSSQRPHAHNSPSFGISAPQAAPLSARRACAPSSGQYEDYENVPSSPKQPASGFVTNDIYESCRNPTAVEAGWVDNEIYGY
ncbi:layilin [Sardina pilchardus]|uniref:layilin n=1 Tax=Sardina pilchardus TaxID=27697 RepID=UPI002E0DF037